MGRKKDFRKRYLECRGRVRDNASMHAGSAMLYYCRWCRIHTDSRAEGHYGMGPARTLCYECEKLLEAGVDLDRQIDKAREKVQS